MIIQGSTADDLYKQCWWKLPKVWIEEDSRNGRVCTVPAPIILELRQPDRRVVFNHTRDANPFFHIAEVVWMFAGSDDVRFVEQFNKRYRDYADEGTDTVWGAYGKRWLYHFATDQIQEVIQVLKRDPTSRQAVMAMWSPWSDLGTPGHNDRPCNTQIMFRVVRGRLDMLVTNRSNDLVWGALGANVVHFTYLHEVIARSIGVPMGIYRVVTNNLHFYPDMPRAEEHLNNSRYFEIPPYPQTIPVLTDGETWEDLHRDCVNYLEGVGAIRTAWMCLVAVPIMEAYLDRENRRDIILEMEPCDWKEAALQWMSRRFTP